MCIACFGRILIAAGLTLNQPSWHRYNKPITIDISYSWCGAGKIETNGRKTDATEKDLPNAQMETTMSVTALVQSES